MPTDIDWSLAPWFYHVKLFLLGSATVLDTALLLILLERNNRRRLIVPLLLLVLGVWLYHVGATLQTLIEHSQGRWVPWLQDLTATAMMAGLLLLPCAMLHGYLRAASSGFDNGIPLNWRFAGLYLPLLLIIPFVFTDSALPTLSFEQRVADWADVYLLLVGVINFLVGVGFLRLRASFELPWARRFMWVVGYALSMLAGLQLSIVFIVLPLIDPLWAPLLWLVLALSPVPLVVLVGYFIIRYNFMQLVLERVFVYGVIVAAIMLFHQVFLDELWDVLSARYQVDFAIVEAIVVIALVLAYRPLRQRSAEALRYLLGARVAQLRTTTRQFAIEMAQLVGQPQQRILDWFCQRGSTALGVGYISIWLFASDGKIAWRAGKALDFEPAYDLFKALQQRDFCRPGDAPSAALGEAMYLLETALAVRIDHPNIQGLLLFGRNRDDITEERRNAIIILSEQLAITLNTSLLQASRLTAERRALQNDKLSTLGLLSSSIAHEVKNPLSSIKTITTVMAEELGPTSEHAEALSIVKDEIERLSQTVNQLLNFSKPALDELIHIDLSALVSATLQVLRHLAEQRKVQINTELDSEMGLIAARENSMREVLMNLIVNAIEAVTAGGTVTISCQRKGKHALLNVSDDGPGIAAELRDCLFEPFVSGKENGTGLGLYVVGRHVREHGGEINCISNAGEGTVFQVRLPLVNA